MTPLQSTLNAVHVLQTRLKVTSPLVLLPPVVHALEMSAQLAPLLSRTRDSNLSSFLLGQVPHLPVYRQNLMRRALIPSSMGLLPTYLPVTPLLSITATIMSLALMARHHADDHPHDTDDLAAPRHMHHDPDSDVQALLTTVKHRILSGPSDQPAAEDAVTSLTDQPPTKDTSKPSHGAIQLAVHALFAKSISSDSPRACLRYR